MEMAELDHCHLLLALGELDCRHLVSPLCAERRCRKRLQEGRALHELCEVEAVCSSAHLASARWMLEPTLEKFWVPQLQSGLQSDSHALYLQNFVVRLLPFRLRLHEAHCEALQNALDVQSILRRVILEPVSRKD